MFGGCCLVTGQRILEIFLLGIMLTVSVYKQFTLLQTAVKIAHLFLLMLQVDQLTSACQRKK